MTGYEIALILTIVAVWSAAMLYTGIKIGRHMELTRIHGALLMRKASEARKRWRT